MNEADKLSGLREILWRRFDGGSRVTNCVSHMSRPWNERPSDCQLCAIDISNQLQFAIRVNDFLNEIVDDARKAIA